MTDDEDDDELENVKRCYFCGRILLFPSLGNVCAQCDEEFRA